MANTNLTPNTGYTQLQRDNPILTGLAGVLAVVGLLGSVSAASIAPNTGSLTVTGTTGTISTPIVLTPAGTTAALTGIAPTVQIAGTGSPVLNTSNRAVVLTGNSPSLILGSVRQPGTGALNLQRSTSQTTNVGVLTLTGKSPALFYGNIQPITGALVFTGYTTGGPGTGVLVRPSQGTLYFGEGSVLTPFVGNLAFQSTAGTVQAAGSRIPTGTSLAFTGFAPNVSQFQNTIVTTNAGSLATAGGQPLFTKTIVNPVGTLVLTPTTPTVISSNLVTPLVGSLVLTGKTGAFFINAFIDPTATLTLTGVVPGVGRGLVPPAGTLTLTGQLCGVLGADTTCTPSVATLTLTPTTPVIPGPQITPTSGALALVTAPPTLSITGSVSAIPPTAALVVDSTAGTKPFGTPYTPGTAALVLAGQTSAILGPQLTPGTGALVSASLPPTFSVDSGSQTIRPLAGVAIFFGATGTGSVTGHARFTFHAPTRIRSFKSPAQA